MVDRKVHTGFWWGDLKGRDHLRDLGLDWRIILKCIVKKYDGNLWTASSSGQGEVTGCCECGN
jgi:seryl-tRNA synthetase